MFLGKETLGCGGLRGVAGERLCLISIGAYRDWIRPALHLFGKSDGRASSLTRRRKFDYGTHPGISFCGQLRLIGLALDREKANQDRHSEK